MTFRKTTQLSAFTLLVAALFAVGCGSDSASAPSAGSSTSASSGVNLTGAWTGTFVTQGSNDRPSPATWAATQSGASPTGVFGLTVDNGVKIAGTLSGVMSGSQVAWTMSFPAGTFTAMGSATCVVTGSGTSPTVTTNSVNVTLTLTFTAPCVGVVTDAGKTTEVDILVLSK